MNPLTYPLALPFSLACGLLAGACVLYLIVRSALGSQQLIGERVTSCIAGLVSFAFGGVITIYLWDPIQANITALPIAALPASLLLLGLYIVPISLFGSNERIERIFKDIVGRH